jgi:acyl-CoA synthetase (AMP-forming)/AMP-acid ligase II/acyl carrier protein
MHTGRDVAPTLPRLLAVRAEDDPERTAVEVAGGASLTFGQWRDGAGRLAAGLLALGVRPGDRVALSFDDADWTGFAVAFCGVLAAGGVAVPLSSRMSTEAATTVLAHCGAVGVVHGGEPPGTTPWKATVPELSATRALDHSVRVAPGDPAQILYTSGTTGSPKAVVACHANLAHGWAAPRRQRPLAHSRHFVHGFPLGTNAAQTMLCNALGAAPAGVMVPRAQPGELIAVVERYRAGTVFLVPATAAELASLPVELPDVLLVGCTGAALPPAVATALTSTFPNATVANYYTSTEAAPAQTTMIHDPARPTSVGRPTAGELQIRDPDGRELPVGEVGDVWLSSPTTARTYLDDPGASAAVFRNGWTRMGDVGRLDADGYLHLVDRESDLVQVGGFKVATMGVEAVLFEHPAVADAAVLGVPHPVLGTTVGAAVVPRGPVEPAELRAFVRSRLTEAEVPTRILVVAELPRNDGGKVVKRELADLFAAAGTVPLRTGSERALGALWTEVLAVPTVTADANFFALGGDSFRAADLAAAMTRTFGVEVPTTLALDHPDLAEQAAWLDGRHQ